MTTKNESKIDRFLKREKWSKEHAEHQRRLNLTAADIIRQKQYQNQLTEFGVIPGEGITPWPDPFAPHRTNPIQGSSSNTGGLKEETPNQLQLWDQC